MERVNLLDYNSVDFAEYLPDNNMDTTITAPTKIKTKVSHNFPPAPPSVIVTVQIEDDEVDTQGERRKICNQKRAIRRHRTAERRKDWGGDSYDYSNSDLRNVINIGHDARNIIISKRWEREEIEAYSPISNYRIPKDYLEQP